MWNSSINVSLISGILKDDVLSCHLCYTGDEWNGTLPSIALGERPVITLRSSTCTPALGWGLGSSSARPTIMASLDFYFISPSLNRPLVGLYGRASFTNACLLTAGAKPARSRDGHLQRSSTIPTRTSGTHQRIDKHCRQWMEPRCSSIWLWKRSHSFLYGHPLPGHIAHHLQSDLLNYQTQQEQILPVTTYFNYLHQPLRWSKRSVS